MPNSIQFNWVELSWICLTYCHPWSSAVTDTANHERQAKWPNVSSSRQSDRSQSVVEIRVQTLETIREVSCRMLFPLRLDSLQMNRMSELKRLVTLADTGNHWQSLTVRHQSSQVMSGQTSVCNSERRSRLCFEWSSVLSGVVRRLGLNAFAFNHIN